MWLMGTTTDKSSLLLEYGNSRAEYAPVLDDVCRFVRALSSVRGTGTSSVTLSTGGKDPFIEGELRIEAITGDGSDRSFFRVRAGTNSFVLMYNPPEDSWRLRENAAFGYLSRYLLAKGIPVPRVYFCDAQNGFFLMEDLGDVSLHSYIIKHPEARKTVLRKAIRLLASFHESAGRDLDSSFLLDGGLYSPEFVLEKELEYFRRSFLCDFLGIHVSWMFLRDDFSKLAEVAGSYEDSSCIHRDFQSRNIMIKQGKLRLIDYQGMRYGPCEYDLASLMIDPYMGISAKERLSLIQLYSRLRKSFSPARYEVVSLCRNLQILAAFAFLGKQKGKTFFLRFIPRAWKELIRNRSMLVHLGLKNLLNVLNLAENRMKAVLIN